MNAIVAVVLALQVRGADPWFGIDKVKHFFLSAMVQSVAYSTLRATNLGHRSSLLGASAVTLSLGVGKELFDRRHTGLFSPRDLVWDAAGAGTASLLLDRTAR